MPNCFHTSMTLTDAIRQTAINGRLTPEQLQDEIDYRAITIRRAATDGESGAGLNLRKLLPLMRAQDDYTILEWLAYRSGKLLIDIPVSGRSKKNKRISVAELQGLAAQVVQTLINLVDNGNDPKDAENLLYQMLKSTAAMMENVKKGNQIELDFGSNP